MKSLALRDVLILIVVVCGWAFNVIAMKLGLTELPPLFMLCLRFILVAAILVPFYPVALRQLPWLILLAFTFGFVHFGMMVLGMQSADAGSTAVLIQMGTPIAMIMAAVWLKEALTLQKIVGVVAAFAGVVILAGSPALSSGYGTLMLLISASGWALSTILVKRAPMINPLAMTGWISLLAVPMLATASFTVEQHQITLLLHAGWRGWLGIIYSALGSSVLAYSLWYGVLKRYPANQILPWSLFSPALAVMMGALLLGEHLDEGKLAGAALIVGGILISVIPRTAVAVANQGS